MEPALTPLTSHRSPPDAIDMARVRACIRTQGKIALSYRDETARETRRVIWPIAVSYWDAVRLIVAWCEMRNGFRHFRTDRVVAAEFLEARYSTPRAKLRALWRREMEGESDGNGYRTRKVASAPMAGLVE
jgi:predicted DNA-binding transcriptional regulator YafY